ncbi:MAG TPA: YdcF family protein, partial [Mycobacteriales bacterium]|nr:YdcF family protein [Mycobacteriales bacterium]
HGVTSVVALGTGSDTLQSVKAVARELDERGWHSAVIVTDPWHCLRSRRMAQDLGLEVHTSPTRSGPAVGSRGTEVRYVARETAAYLYYRLFHRSSEAGPHAV